MMSWNILDIKGTFYSLDYRILIKIFNRIFLCLFSCPETRFSKGCYRGNFLSETGHVIYRRNREEMNFSFLEFFFLYRCLLVHSTGSFLILGASSTKKGIFSLHMQGFSLWAHFQFVGSFWGWFFSRWLHLSFCSLLLRIFFQLCGGKNKGGNLIF